MSRDEERRARAGLAMVLEPASVALLARLQDSTPERLWELVVDGALGETARERAAAQAEAIPGAIRSDGWRFVIPGDEEWPQTLDALAEAEPRQDVGGVPLGLWVRGAGSLADATAGSVAVVGSRAATQYGTTVATELAAGLGERGVTIVSGGAYGIDAAAHRGALAARTRTVCVVASGVDQPYPAGNAGLIERIAHDGLVVSEYPPLAHPTRMRFLARNRLIAALSQGTVLVEAAARSGARNTIAWAQELGRLVMAVPGPVTSPTSVGPHRLLRDHEASLVTCDAEIAELLAPLGQATLFDAVGDTRPVDSLTAAERQVYEAMPSRGARSVEWLVLQTGLDWPGVAVALSRLETAHLVERRADGYGLGVRRGSSHERQGAGLRLIKNST